MADLRKLAEAATPGPWSWFGNTHMKSIYLATVNGGRRYVMKFARWGMQCAQPRFQQPDLWMHDAKDLVVYEADHREDFHDIDNADARYIAAASPDAVLGLYDDIDKLRVAVALTEFFAGLRLLKAETCIRECHRFIQDVHEATDNPFLSIDLIPAFIEADVEVRKSLFASVERLTRERDEAREVSRQQYESHLSLCESFSKAMDERNTARRERDDAVRHVRNLAARVDRDGGQRQSGESLYDTVTRIDTRIAEMYQELSESRYRR